MPIVHIDIKKGRTVEQKRAMVKEVTKAIAETLDAKESAIRIVINEMEKENFAVSGVLDCDSN